MAVPGAHENWPRVGQCKLADVSHLLGVFQGWRPIPLCRSCALLPTSCPCTRHSLASPTRSSMSPKLCQHLAVPSTGISSSPHTAVGAGEVFPYTHSVTSWLGVSWNSFLLCLCLSVSASLSLSFCLFVSLNVGFQQEPQLPPPRPAHSLHPSSLGHPLGASSDSP